MDNIFTACFVDYHFDEQLFPQLEKDETPIMRSDELILNYEKLYNLDPLTC